MTLLKKLTIPMFALQFLLFSLLALGAKAPESLVLVSDVDDTLKITNVLSARHGLYNLFRGKNIFLGMPELYQEMAHEVEPVIYLSSSLDSFTGRVKGLLEKSGFPGGLFFLSDWSSYRSWRYWVTGRKFKRQKLKDFAAEEGLPFLLVGDDTQHDPEVYDEFRQLHPERILSIYIHQVKGKDLPEGITPYSIALEIALNEVEAGRLTHESAKRVANVILDLEHPELHADNFRLLFPHFKLCPKEFSLKLGPVASTDSELAALSSKVETDVREFCAHRIL